MPKSDQLAATTSAEKISTKELDGWDDYLPRSALSRGPEATETVLLPSLEVNGSGYWRGVLTLFIDDTGQVRRVRSELDDSGHALSPTLEDSVRQAFLAARFSPGEVAGRAVRSRIRVEVEFVADAAPRAAGAPGATSGM